MGEMNLTILVLVAVSWLYLGIQIGRRMELETCLRIISEMREELCAEWEGEGKCS